MGVPVVTLPGETFASRCSLSHLSNIGLTETVASTADEYVEIAVALASDLPRWRGRGPACAGGWRRRPCATASGSPRTLPRSSVAFGGSGARRGGRQHEAACGFSAVF